MGRRDVAPHPFEPRRSAPGTSPQARHARSTQISSESQVHPDCEAARREVDADCGITVAARPALPGGVTCRPRGRRAMLVPNSFDWPIPNSPCVEPSRVWELDANDRPTRRVVDERRGSEPATALTSISIGQREAASGNLLEGHGHDIGTTALDPSPLCDVFSTSCIRRAEHLIPPSGACHPGPSAALESDPGRREPRHRPLPLPARGRRGCRGGDLTDRGRPAQRKGRRVASRSARDREQHRAAPDGADSLPRGPTSCAPRSSWRPAPARRP